MGQEGIFCLDEEYFDLLRQVKGNTHRKSCQRLECETWVDSGGIDHVSGENIGAHVKEGNSKYSSRKSLDVL